MLLSGAKIVLECLSREKVDCIFGYPGGVTLPLYDALYDSPIKHVLVRHEQNACFAAEGYARDHRQSGRVPARRPVRARPIWSPGWSMR